MSDYPGWRETPCPVAGARAFELPNQGLRVILSTDSIRGHRWLHASLSRRNRTPSYDDVHLVKRIFIGDLLSAYQVFPPRTEHVNIHEHCLHLWAPLDGDPFPEELTGPSP